MGFRFRKSIKIGKHFKINISKSGIGYSYGFSGFRRTHSARGGRRTTISIPGTGLSYSVSSGNKSKRNSYRSSKKTHTTNHSNNKPDYSKLPNYGISETEYISTAEIDNFKTTEFSEFTEQLESIIRLNSVLNVLMGISAFLTIFSLRFFVLSVLFLLCFTITSILKLYIVFSSKNNIQYESKNKK